ncbi:hypothetical protein L843_0174 [Mycobacterium intracellulare MIN_061107_1834]|nr:hypothetical protein L843_0174 [Mycobacterium intracellulare MIN_061107_1834]
MGWPVFTATFTAARPPAAVKVADHQRRAKELEANLDWMEPSVTFTREGVEVQLTVHAPSAESAIAHARGSFRSALHGAHLPGVALWPVIALESRRAVDEPPQPRDVSGLARTAIEECRRGDSTAEAPRTSHIDTSKVSGQSDCSGDNLKEQGELHPRRRR